MRQINTTGNLRMAAMSELPVVLISQQDRADAAQPVRDLD
jgi:hypothetical protein